MKLTRLGSRPTIFISLCDTVTRALTSSADVFDNLIRLLETYRQQ